ncbi:type II toxin-antitoxin system VapC family toxin [Geminicoccus harenae]|uniref:type II toxin-antitoxin system VapC family toxin n=1 Tax=Geminicoccus harenae TaxID=2498453 RepID=UPI00168B0B8F|nr:PIN domain-containing protein [Geminicoccus harenae]
MIVADTSVWIDFLRGAGTERSRLIAIAADADELVVPDLVIYELMAGAITSRDRLLIERKVASYRVVDVAGDDRVRAAAEHYRFLRNRGISIRKTVDVLIASFCITERAPLIHDDRDFDPFEQHLGLRVLR